MCAAHKSYKIKRKPKRTVLRCFVKTQSPEAQIGRNNNFRQFMS